MKSESNVKSARENPPLTPYLSRWGAWAFSLGTAIGWGSLVVTSNTYLLQAGPAGSVIGLVIGAVVMVVIARNYHYLINRFPTAGGAYTYAKEILGYDYGFLTAWFLALVYLAILWANATSLPLFSRYFIGDLFKVGFCFTVFGYDVYLGEALLSIVAMFVMAWLCSRSRRAVMHAMVVMAVLLCCCIGACFVSSLVGHVGGVNSVEPSFLPEKSVLHQVMRIACISSWAFIGFENVSHFAEEYRFPRKGIFRVMVVAIATATVLYAMVMLLSVMAFPPEYANWRDYLADLPNLSGIKGMPAFYAAHRFCGNMGVRLLMAALLCLVLTSLIGNTVALSRLFYALAQDGVLPRRLAVVSDNGIPRRAVLLVAVASLPIPFLGRTAVGWIVDVTTIGATIIYGLVSAFAYHMGKARQDKTAQSCGALGLGLMVSCGLYLLLPSLLFFSKDLAYESYFIFAVWGLLGFVLFRNLLSRDGQHRFGRSVVVWIGLLSVVMFVSFLWTSQSVMDTVGATMNQLIERAPAGVASSQDDYALLADLMRKDMGDSVLFTTLVGAGILLLASVLLLSNFSYMSNWAQESEKELDLTRDILDNDPLTGLPSAKRFQELATVVCEAMWSQDEVPVALAFDLMGMKDFNAKNGRTAGDQLLVAFAGVLRSHFGSGACARVAEDSFCAVTTQDGVTKRVDALFSDFAKANDGLVLPVRAGAYACRPNEDVVSVGVDRARTARDRDRRTWQSHLTWFNEDMGDEASVRLHVLDSLDQAIEERWIRPYYQAVVAAKTGDVVEEEALARWIDPQQGFLSPGEFIPIVENAGLLHKVDMHMLDCVLEDMATKHALGVPVVPVSVNISLDDLGQLDIAKEITSRVDAAQVAHHLLHVEFTESVASNDPEVLRRAMESLQAEGFEVWMDDFGSGYSSLNSLKDFAFDVVKLDMDFIRGAQNAKTWDIVSGVIGITKRIGAQSLAEGVETEEQARNLEEAGCDMLQGYLYSRPLPLEEVVERYRSGAGPLREDSSDAKPRSRDKGGTCA